jgi:hypothetical protein
MKITWDNVKRVIDDAGQCGITNQQIMAALQVDARDQSDVMQLTRMIALAGEATVATKVRASIGNIYYSVKK